MGVFDGQPVSAAVTNPAFLDANADDIALGKIGFHNTDPVSGSFIDNIQRAVNTIWTTTGATETIAATTYGAPANTIVNGTSHLAALIALANKFHGTTGHTHNGTDGDGSRVLAASIASVPLQGYYRQAANIAGVTGSSWVVTSEMSGKTATSTSTTAGVVVNAPYNKVILLQASGVNAGDEFVDSQGNEVYGRITESGGVWTLSFYVDNAGIETAYSFASISHIKWYYQELINPLSGLAPVYSEHAFLPSENATADVITATSGLQGKVLLASSAPPSIGTANAAGTANATVANADHTHQGVHGLNTDGSTNLFGDVQITGTGGSVVSQAGQVITVTSPAIASTAPESVGSANAVGVGTTSARADHVHQGVHGINTDGSTNIFGDVQFVGSGAVSVTQLGQVVTISAATFPGYGVSAQSVGSANAAGVAATVSRSDHVHQGVHSVSKSGSSQLFGDVTLTAGLNVTLNQVGNDIEISASGGGGGGSADFDKIMVDENFDILVDEDFNVLVAE